jgi:very-short-patch-repair endonuclease
MSARIKIPNKEELQVKYAEFGVSISSLAKEYNTSNPTVRKWLDIHNIPKKTQIDASREANILKSKKTFTINRDWLYQKRFIEKLSIDSIGDILGCSITPINAALKEFDLTSFDARRKSHSSIDFLNNKDWMFEQYYDKHLTLEQIGDILEVSKSTIQVHMEKHGYSPRNPNDYDVKFVKSSFAENEIVEYLREIRINNIQTGNRTVLGGRELDIYLPDHNIAIEHDGLFYHNETQKHKNYHHQKTKDCEDRGIFLIHIFEDEWKLKKTICKSILSAKLGKSIRVYARDTICREISVQQKDHFLNENHLQGCDRSKIKLGLFHKKTNELLAVMTFCKPRFSKDANWELSRYACKSFYTVVGGFSKLMNHANLDGHIVSYSDSRWSKGNVYSKNGFTLHKTNKPSYSYIDFKRGIRINRMFLQKKNFPELQDQYTERYIAKILGYVRIYDCGTRAWITSKVRFV